MVWSAVKMDYRSFLNEEALKTEERSRSNKGPKMTDLVDSMTWNNISDGVDALVLRVSYVNYFALAMENVPARFRLKMGRLWKSRSSTC